MIAPFSFANRYNLSFRGTFIYLYIVIHSYYKIVQRLRLTLLIQAPTLGKLTPQTSRSVALNLHGYRKSWCLRAVGVVAVAHLCISLTRSELDSQCVACISYLGFTLLSYRISVTAAKMAAIEDYWAAPR